MNSLCECDTRKVRVVLASYYLRPDEMLQLARQAFRHWPGVKFDLYSTNTAHGGTALSTHKCRVVPNELNDFSAYSAACADLVRGGLRFGGGDVFIFANDTLFLKHPAPSLLRLLRRTLPSVREAAVPILSGKADSYRALLQTSPFAVGLDRYVATFLFATNAQGVSLLDAVFHSVETKVLLDGVASMIGAGVPKKFFAFLRMHLGDSASVFAWHGERAPEMISRKACCVLLEHLVSAKFFEEGFLAPINSSAILNGGMLASYAIRGVKRKIARRRDRLD